LFHCACWRQNKDTALPLHPSNGSLKESGSSIFSMPPLSKVDSGHGVRGANIVGGHDSARSRLPEPLVYSGSLDNFTQQDLTPVIGREFEGLQATDLLRWGDGMIRDLAITSTTPSAFPPTTKLTSYQSHNAVSYSCATKLSHQLR
jgi:hypothetical protein